MVYQSIPCKVMIGNDLETERIKLPCSYTCTYLHLHLALPTYILNSGGWETHFTVSPLYRKRMFRGTASYDELSSAFVRSVPHPPHLMAS